MVGATMPLAFRIRNLGPIESADLELGALTIIAGRNNTGKTYLTHSLYGFLKWWQQRTGAARLLANDGEGPPAAFPDLGALAKRIFKGSRASFPLSREEFGQHRAIVIQRLNTFFSRQAKTGAAGISHPVDGASIELTGSLEHDPGARSTAAQSGSEASGLALEYDGRRVVITARHYLGRWEPSGRPEDHLSHDYVDLLLPGVLSDPFILSAERFGISLFYRELGADRSLAKALQLIAGEFGGEDAGPVPPFLIDRPLPYTLPVNDNLAHTAGIRDHKLDKSDLHGSRIFDYLREMIDGNYSVNYDGIRFRSRSRGQDRPFNIALPAASSSVRGLSDLYFFLRNVARKGQLIMIDHPESQLDTANQIRLARLLAQIVNAGVRVLITTHSDYLIKEFNNLVMLSRQFAGKADLVKRLGYKRKDFLARESIRAYVAENNSLTKCAVDRFGTDVPVFDATIDAINHAANELTARLQEG